MLLRLCGTEMLIDGTCGQLGVALATIVSGHAHLPMKHPDCRDPCHARHHIERYWHKVAVPALSRSSSSNLRRRPLEIQYCTFEEQGQLPLLFCLPVGVHQSHCSAVL